MSRIITPQVLILTSRFDLSCDYVIAELRRLGTSYFRLNHEDLDHFAIIMTPDPPEVILRAADFTVKLSPNILKSVYYRLAVYPREPKTDKHSLQEQLRRAHGSMFMRSFMVFDSCLWINSPVAIYKAEHKAIQLQAARRLGFTIPDTAVTNDEKGVLQAANGSNAVAVKGLDTVLAWREGMETFGYTSIIDPSSVTKSELFSTPVIAQQPLKDKIDIRVTVVGQRVFAASITNKGEPIQGDWRLKKTDADVRSFTLPSETTERCLKLVKALGLEFGAIDLALQQGTYFFLEINPTGEWGWLMNAELPIAKALAEVLSRERAT